MNRRPVFRRIARAELNDAIAWYENRQPGRGLELKTEVEALLERILSTPEHFPHVRGTVRRALLRRFPYAIHFLVETDRVVVLVEEKMNKAKIVWRKENQEE